MSILDRLFESKEAKAERLAREAKIKAEKQVQEAALQAVKNFRDAIANGDRNKVESLLKEIPAAAKSQALEEGLQVAAGNDLVEIAHILVQFGANVNGRSKDGHTPLHFAVGTGSLKMTEWLLRHGALVNATNNIGWTAIHSLISACTGKSIGRDDSLAKLRAAKCKLTAPAILSLLIKHGANVNVNAVMFGPPLKFAKDFNQSEIAEILRSHGARE